MRTSEMLVADCSSGSDHVGCSVARDGGADVVASRGERRRCARSIVEGKLRAAYERIQALECDVASWRKQSKGHSICQACKCDMDEELEIRIEAIRPYLAAQVLAQKVGSDVVDAPLSSKLCRDAGAHACEIDAVVAGTLHELRACRKQSRLPSRLLSQVSSSMKTVDEVADAVIKDIAEDCFGDIDADKVDHALSPDFTPHSTLEVHADVQEDVAPCAHKPVDGGVGNSTHLCVTGCAHDTIGPCIRGNFHHCGENHGRPAYRKDAQVNGLDVMLYFWDMRHGASCCGWWIGPVIGGDQVWPYQPASSATPPRSGWKAPCDGPQNTSIALAAVWNGSCSEEVGSGQLLASVSSSSCAFCSGTGHNGFSSCPCRSSCTS